MPRGFVALACGLICATLVFAFVWALNLGLIPSIAVTVPDGERHAIPHCAPNSACAADYLMSGIDKVAVKIDTFDFGYNDVKTVNPSDPLSNDSQRLTAIVSEAYLEYCESGELFDRNQVDAINAWIKSASGGPILLNVFVHGWHNNGIDPANDPIERKLVNEGVNQKSDFDSVRFHYLGARIVALSRRLFELRNELRAPKVLSVYVAWRGERLRPSLEEAGEKGSFLGTLLAPLTVGDRGGAANRLGEPPAEAYGNGPSQKNDYDACPRSGGSPESRSLKGNLSEIAKTLQEAAPDGAGRMLIEGVSFGGRALTMAFRKDIAMGNFQPLGPFATIMLVNPAVSADCFDFSEPADSLAPPLDRPPSWINITNANDNATGLYYRAARFLGLLGDGCNDRALPFGITDAAIGHEPSYITSTMLIRNEFAFDNNFDKADDTLTNECFPETIDQARKINLKVAGALYPLHTASERWFDQPAHHTTMAFPERDRDCPASHPGAFADKSCYPHAPGFGTQYHMVLSWDGYFATPKDVDDGTDQLDFVKPVPAALPALRLLRRGVMNIWTDDHLISCAGDRKPKPFERHTCIAQTPIARLALDVMYPEPKGVPTP